MVISISAQKGGCGKTTTTISIAAYLARKGSKVLVIDLDGQCNTSFVLMPNYPTLAAQLLPPDTIASILDDDLPLKIYPTLVPNLFVVPSHPNLSEANVILSTLVDKERRLLYALEEAREEYDYILIDCPPDVSFLPYSALVASDYVIIPSSPNRFDLQGLNLLVKKIESVSSPRMNPNLQLLGHLLTFRDQTILAKEVYKSLQRQFPGAVFDTQIPRNVKAGEANNARMDIFGYDPHCPAAQAYKKLIEEEILPKLNK